MLLIEDKREGYVVSKNNYKGWVTAILKGARSTYTNYTFEQIQADTPDDELEVIYDFDVYYEKYHKPYELSLQKEWKEITEEQYYEMLECLPPWRWRKIDSNISCFAVSECYTMSLHSFCLEVTTEEGLKYFSALRSIYTSDESIANNFKQQYYGNN